METTSEIMDTANDERNDYGTLKPIKIETMLDNHCIQAKDYPTLITKINGVPLNMATNFSREADNVPFSTFDHKNVPVDLTKRVETEYILREVAPVQSYRYASLNVPVSGTNHFRSDPLQTPSFTHQRIMMMAKTAFSKRTRTLYHWMHPQATKNQISLAIENAWNSLSHEEKDVYIAQARGKNMYGHSGPMVNPHLEKVLPMAMALTSLELNGKTVQSMNERPYNVAQICAVPVKWESVIHKSRNGKRGILKQKNNKPINRTYCSNTELESALSSITNIQESDATLMKPKSKKLNMRPKSNKISFKIEDFENDSELLKELVQFESLYRKKK